jgi:predicted transcriptional regulator
MMPLTDTKLRILYYLINDRGHPLWEIAENLEIDESYCSKKIKELKEMDMIYKLDVRKSTRFGPNHSNQMETPIYINKNYIILRKIQSGLERKQRHHIAKANKEFPKRDHSQILLNQFQTFQRWLDVTITACHEAGRDARLDPSPLSFRDMEALIFGWGQWATPE